MPVWVGTALSLVMAVLAAGVTVGVLRGTLMNVVEGQKGLLEAVTKLATSVATLTTQVALNSHQYEELSRRISTSETKMGELSEICRVLRTRSHIHANKLMELDPSFKLYPVQRTLDPE